ncbi:MAG: DUF4842 domain-containing protein [Prevotella sp.]|nr:DUF4842 domain-containing protein [Prevotella sp.]
MKKYLINGLLAIFVGGLAVSCADHDVDYVPLGQQKTQAYNQAFKELIGGDVDPNQNWGFTGVVDNDENESSPSRPMTRADWGDITTDYNYTFTRTKIDEILSALPEGISAGSKLNDYEFESKGPIEFCIVYAITSALDEVGYYYYDPTLDANAQGGSNKPNYMRFVDNIQNQIYFQYGFADGHNWGTPVVNPNPNGNNYCGDCKNNFNKEYYQWTCDHVKDHWNIDQVRAKKLTINIPAGNRMGFWVKNGDNVMYSKKSRNADGNFYSAVAIMSDGTYAVGLEDWWQGDFDCNDIVMAINPTSTKPGIVNYSQTVTTRSTQHKKYKKLLAQGRVFCEDLGAAGQKDIDFNDIVFDARIWKTQEYDETTINGDANNREWVMGPIKYEADICMLAAGGTIPAKMFNTENVHDLFEGKPGQTTMINTVDSHAGKLTTWDNMKAFPGAKEYYDVNITSIITALQTANPNHKITVNDIPISVLWQTSDNPETATLDWTNSTMQTVGELHADPGTVPHKICLPIGTKWPSERRSIIEAYQDFASWAQKETNENKTFYNNRNDNAIYHENGWDASLTMTNPYGGTFANDDSDLEKEFYINIGSPTVTEEIITTEFTLQETDIILYNGGQAMGDWKEEPVPAYANWNDLAVGGKVIIIGTVDDGKEAKMRARDAWWQRCFIGDNQNTPVFNGYAEFTLQYTNDKERFGKDGDQLYIDGQYFTLNYVIYRPQ